MTSLEIRLHEAADRAIQSTIALGASLYRRDIILPRLIPFFPEDTTDQIVDRLTRAIAGEEGRGRAGHWSFSMTRLIALKQALEAERRTIDA